MELKKMPVVGQILEASGTIFLDRTDKEKAIEALKPAIDSLKSGISIVIFPEGTRSYDYTLGSFKKGAFHIAMEAGVPIVPIVPVISPADDPSSGPQAQSTSIAKRESERSIPPG